MHRMAVHTCWSPPTSMGSVGVKCIHTCPRMYVCTMLANAHMQGPPRPPLYPVSTTLQGCKWFHVARTCRIIGFIETVIETVSRDASGFTWHAHGHFLDGLCETILSGYCSEDRHEHCPRLGFTQRLPLKPCTRGITAMPVSLFLSP